MKRTNKGVSLHSKRRKGEKAGESTAGALRAQEQWETPQVKACQPGPVPLLRSGAGQPRGTRAAPGPGTCHPPGDGDRLRLGHGPMGGPNKAG